MPAGVGVLRIPSLELAPRSLHFARLAYCRHFSPLSLQIACLPSRLYHSSTASALSVSRTTLGLRPRRALTRGARHVWSPRSMSLHDFSLAQTAERERCQEEVVISYIVLHGWFYIVSCFGERYTTWTHYNSCCIRFLNPFFWLETTMNNFE